MSPVNAIPMLIPGCGYKIEHGLRLQKPNSPYLYRAVSSVSSATTKTFSIWLRRTTTGVLHNVAGTNESTSFLAVRSDDTLHLSVNTSGGATGLITTQKLKDQSGWYHVQVTIDTTNATSSERLRLYVNGARITSFSTAVYPAQNATVSYLLAAGYTFYLSSAGSSPNAFIDGGIAEVHVVDGLALEPTAFGVFNGAAWVPIKYYGAHGTAGGFYEFANPAALGTDSSGNGNTLTVTGALSTDQVTDTPSYVSAVLDYSNRCSAAVNVTNGGLRYENGAGEGYYGVYSTLSAASGKIQYEVTVGASGEMYEMGWVQMSPKMITNGLYNVGAAANALTTAFLYIGYSIATYKITAYKAGTVQSSTTLSALSAGVTITVLVDFSTMTMEFKSNGVSLGTITLPDNNGLPYLPYVGAHWSDVGSLVNFGQRPFAYPATGYTGLTTAVAPPSATTLSGSFTGTGAVEGPKVHCGGCPVDLTINGNAVTWGTHAIKQANGFKIITSSSSYNSTGTNTWSTTAVNKMVSGECHIPNTAQLN